MKPNRAIDCLEKSVSSFAGSLMRFLMAGILASGILACQRPEKGGISYSGNPILPGDFADPSLVVHRDTFYIYATSGEEATVWRSADFMNWKLTKLNWPSSMNLPAIWAPAVCKGPDGRFYLYTSTDHNIYAGVAEHPLGPFSNILGGDSIFIRNRQWWEKMHTIDADCFVDEDGRAYLYWGSGFDFRDGLCAAGVLGENMASFEKMPELITPDNYFEGPHMLKRNGTYYLMYSDGFYYDSTYKVRYATSKFPLGPFTEGLNSPILKSSPDGMISGPGHHFTMQMGDAYYIIYHRHAIPLYSPGWGPIRQVCIDRLEFTENGAMKKVVATREGVPLDFIENRSYRMPVSPQSSRASGSRGEEYGAPKAFDDSHGTLWAVDNSIEPVWLEADFGKMTTITSCEPVFDRIMGDYEFQLEYTSGEKDWEIMWKGNNGDVDEWPLEIRKQITARKLRLTIFPGEGFERLGLWELNIYAD